MKCLAKKSFELETEIANFGNDDCEFDVYTIITLASSAGV